ncbi:acetyltransferase [Devosia limi DSM 17137]|uniref:Acetyltransferase n=1 Tax=Devosia limi DSM 17137 TaxID=1121477 RepID=A0A0F5LK71_9HYPH|nr:GNAT family N-acetyltransferase [Devosia limi]KKB82816.1 acetyltransferase [Devosia limi DSM 17137]SHF48224.1 Protein N-acetyltransferase, RimJ/RimL family [Devosia limi DSM 17137]
MITEASASDFALLQVGRAPDDYRLAPGNIAPTEVIEMLSELAEGIRPNFTPCAWMIIEDGEIVGLCSLIRTPEASNIHIGYGVSPSRWGKGIASRAVADVLAWARRHPRVDWVTAETGAENLASQSVLRRNGFEQIGTCVNEEDGPLIQWRKNTAA